MSLVDVDFEDFRRKEQVKPVYRQYLVVVKAEQAQVLPAHSHLSVNVLSLRTEGRECRQFPTTYLVSSPPPKKCF